MSIRASRYRVEEDLLLYQVYMEISQDPITGIHQFYDHFWSRVEEKYNSFKHSSWDYHNKRSVQGRIQIIEKAVRKFNACVRQVESLNPSGASEIDILNCARVLIMEDANYKRGFKFDHVWNITKDFEKFKDHVSTRREKSRMQNVNLVSSESDNPTPESHICESPNLSSFSLNLEDTNIGGSSCDRPIGIKKAKLKRKTDDQTSMVINTLKEENAKLREILEKNGSERLGAFKERTSVQKFKEENKIILMDLNTIRDPNKRAFIAAEQARLMQQRSELHQPPHYASNEYNDYLHNIGGSGTGLPEY